LFFRSEKPGAGLDDAGNTGMSPKYDRGLRPPACAAPEELLKWTE
jgi:hypothetical protein